MKNPSTTGLIIIFTSLYLLLIGYGGGSDNSSMVINETVDDTELSTAFLSFGDNVTIAMEGNEVVIKQWLNL